MSRVIDDGVRFFDIKITDLNNDRREDLLVTINAATNGSVMAYEIPDDFRYNSLLQNKFSRAFNFCVN